MRCSYRVLLYFISLIHFIAGSKIVQSDEKSARKFLASTNKKSIEITSKLARAQWEFETQNSGNAKQELFQATSEAVKNAKANFQTVLTKYQWKSYSDPDIRRQLKFYSEIGMLALPEEKYQEFQEVMSQLEVIQQNTTICDYFNRTKCDLHFYPDIQKKLETSFNLGEISYLWTEWENLTEPKLRNLLGKYVNLSNEAAGLNKYKNYKEYSLRNIQVDNPKQVMENLWETLKPLYEQIHAYVRRKLRDTYGEKIVPLEGIIPSQLLGDVSGENWAGIADRLLPFPEEDETNFTEIMINLSYTPETVQKLAEGYFTSMNFTLPRKLWYKKKSNELNEEVCRPKIFNFYNDDVRIKDCGKISLKGYLEDIRLLTKAEYMLQYSHQPFTYQTPSDPALEIAVLDVLTLSASTFNNLQRMGLFPKEVTEKIRLNRLFKIALEKITAIPYLMVQEFWRWDIFSGKPIEDTLNTLNELRETLQGISTFTKNLNFNPGATGILFSKISLVHNFFAYLLEFQIYESLCESSNLPVTDECNFFKKVDVKNTLRYIMSLGSSKSLREINSILLGESKIETKSILHYFEPLMDWLKTENEKTGEFIGWKIPDNAKEKRTIKLRRKRSADYSLDTIGDDKMSAEEPDRFQRLIYKRSKNNLAKPKESERERKSAENEQKSSEGKAKDSLVSRQKQRRNSENSAQTSYYVKKRRSMTKNNEIDNSKQSVMGEENSFLSNKFSSNLKRHSDFGALDKTYDRSKVYSNTFENENQNNQFLNSYNLRASKCRPGYGSFENPYKNLKTYEGAGEKGHDVDESSSKYSSRNKKRHSESLDAQQDNSYFKENKDFQIPQKHSSRSAKLLSDSKLSEQSQGNSNIYAKTGDDEENSDQIYNKHSSRNAKRHSNSESLDVPQKNSEIYTRTMGKEIDNSQVANKYASKETSRRSNSNTPNIFNDKSELYSRNMEKENKAQTAKYTAIKTKRDMNFNSFDESRKTYSDSLNNEEKNTYQKRSESNTNENKKESNTNINRGESGNNNEVRHVRRVKKNQVRYAEKENKPSQNHQIRRRKEKIQSQNERMSRNAHWHTDTKKDISRLLHSIGFAVENDDKDKIKELKKKLKGDSNSELKGGTIPKENSLEEVDINRIKSGFGKIDTGDSKAANKFWAVKTYLTDNAKMMQPSSNLDKKDGLLNSHLSNSVISKATEEKSVGKKDTSVNSNSGAISIAGSQKVSGNSDGHFSQADENVKRIGINAASLQALLQKADLNNYGQKQIYSLKPEPTENKLKNEMNQQIHVAKDGPNQFLTLSYKCPGLDMLHCKDKKEFRESSDIGGNKSPYIIIVGQLTPEIKEKLLHDKSNLINLEKTLFEVVPVTDEKKQADKRSRVSEQIYIVPIGLKSSQLNLLKPNHYAENEHEAGHDPNLERDQESEEDQLRLEDNSKLQEKSNFYKTGKETPSEFILSWNNDKSRKIVKRSKREHSKEMGDDGLKLLRLAPVKDSLLENFLEKSADQSSVDDKNVQMLIQNALLKGNSEQLSTDNVENSESMAVPIADELQTGSVQPSSSLSSLASRVISALSPKGYSQGSKAANQRQDSDLEEDSMKEAAGNQAVGREGKEELPFLFNSGLRCNVMGPKKKIAKAYSEEDARKFMNSDSPAKDEACCKKQILNSKNPCPCPCPCPCPLPCPLPSSSSSPCPGSNSPSLPGSSLPGPSEECKSNGNSNGPSCPSTDICSKKPSECSLVNCQFKITKAKKPHERLTIMVYDRINPPAELPEPYDSLAVISEILQRIQCSSCKPCSQLTEEDPDYPANDNMDQLKGTENTGQESKNKVQEVSGEMPIMGNESPEEDEMEDNSQNAQQASGPSEEDKYQPREKATPALDQLTVFNKDKLKPLFIELRKIDDILKKRSQHQ